MLARDLLAGLQLDLLALVFLVERNRPEASAGGHAHHQERQEEMEKPGHSGLLTIRIPRSFRKSGNF
jgi:hypothetical protein